jgi:hypothetical protein
LRGAADALNLIVPHGEDADTRRATPFVGTRGEQRPPGRHRKSAHDLSRVDQQWYPPAGAGLCDGGNRLQRADFVVGRLQAGERRCVVEGCGVAAP